MLINRHIYIYIAHLKSLKPKVLARVHFFIVWLFFYFSLSLSIKCFFSYSRLADWLVWSHWQCIGPLLMYCTHLCSLLQAKWHLWILICIHIYSHYYPVWWKSIPLYSQLNIFNSFTPHIHNRMWRAQWNIIEVISDEAQNKHIYIYRVQIVYQNQYIIQCSI